ncbi:MAG: asparaginase [Paracoccaceae bacterium]
MADSIKLVEAWRGDLPESLHRGHVVIADAQGIRASWGDAGAVIFPRSSCKMLQALPLLETGAAAKYRLTTEQIALSCASHNGAPMHTERVSAWLSGLELGESDLRCGTQQPAELDDQFALHDAGQQPCQLHNNCSGKHAGFLTLNAYLGGHADYIELDHPVQIVIKQAFEEMTNETSPGYGVDGCSAPNFACTMAGLARAASAMARPDTLGAARGAAARSLVSAMMAHPKLVSGEGRACAELMAAAKGRAAIKTGAEGVFLAIIPDLGIGVSIKIEDGTTRASEAAMAAVLVHLGILDADDPAVLARLYKPLPSRRGFDAGGIRPHADFAKALGL